MLQSLVKIMKEDIVGTDNRWIAMAWLTSVAAIISMGVYLSSESMSFLGIADSRELQVNFEYPVSVKRVHVLTGQRVEKGELLIELDHSDLNSQIRTLKGQVTRLEAELGIRKDLNKIVGNSASDMSADPLSADLTELQTQLSYLENQKKNLFIFAEVSGLVGAVNFKKGEKAPAFSALITLTPENPSYVQGFIHENMKTKLALDSEVKVMALSSGAKPVKGRVVSVGARMVPLPVRMLHSANIQMWGREVIVEIPEHNGLLIGERVQIKPEVTWVGIPSALASAKEAPNTDVARGVMSMKLPAALDEKMSFEPSGVVYLPDVKRFLVISDDTDKAGTPLAFLMNPDGEIDEEPMRIPDLAKISDVESVSMVGDSVYFMSSLGLSKKGKNKEDRNLFVKATRDGLNLKNTKSVELRERLLRAIASSKDEAVKKAFKNFDVSDLDIEGHFIERGDLYLGLKPLVNNESLILKVPNVESLFANQEITGLSISKTLRLEMNGVTHRLTDLSMIDGHLYATTVCKGKACGAVWKLADSKNPEVLAFYDELKPEGLTYDPQMKSILVTFDAKNKAAKFSRTSLVPQTALTAQNQ